MPLPLILFWGKAATVVNFQKVISSLLTVVDKILVQKMQFYRLRSMKIENLLGAVRTPTSKVEVPNEDLNTFLNPTCHFCLASVKSLLRSNLLTIFSIHKTTSFEIS